jgi:hypothetical protein
MPIYFREVSTGESLPLYVNQTWPEEGRYPFLKCAGRDKSWGEVRYKTLDDILAVDFDEFDGLFSTGFMGCTALLYLYPDNEGGFAGAVLHHVPSGVLSALRGTHGLHGPTHPPEDYGSKLAGLGGMATNVWAVMAIWGTNYKHNVKEHVQFLKEDGVPDERIKIILVDSQGFAFGVRYDGSVGQCGGPPKAITKSVAKATKKKGACYITTAACDARGLADDCDELQTLRRFRDEVLLRHTSGRRLVARYYETAPAVVAAIERLPERRAIYDQIYATYVRPAVDAAKQQDVAAALAILEDVLISADRNLFLYGGGVLP